MRERENERTREQKDAHVAIPVSKRKGDKSVPADISSNINDE